MVGRAHAGLVFAKVARFLIFVPTLGAAMLTLTGDARACSCPDYSYPYTQIPNFDVVFRGTVREVHVPALLEPVSKETEQFRQRLIWPDPGVTIVMDVHESWRGVDTQEVEINTGSGDCCNCSLGERFGRPGDELIVVANWREGVLRAGSCHPPLPIADAGPTLVAFGPGKTVFAPGRTGARRGAGERKSSDLLLLVVGVSSLGLVVIALGTFWARRRTERPVVDGD